MSRPRIHFVTGRLAEHALRATLERLSTQAGFDYSIDVLPITVAALMTSDWIARRLQVPPDATQVILPGYCQGDLAALTEQLGLPVQRGPRDLRDLADFFGQAPVREDYGAYDIEIIAEINHAPRLALADIVRQARSLAAAGADVIDVGCEPGGGWLQVGETIRALRDAGMRVSIDSMDSREIGLAVQAGAELVLSVNSSNREAALDWGCEVVAIPDDIATLGGLDDTVELLATADVRLRIDAILEPIGFGFARSLQRYCQVRDQYPDAEMLMGVGNLTELTDCDSAPVNVLLLGICQELGIRSVLTTQVIPWAQTSVKECDLARRLVWYAVQHRVPPKHLERDLVLLRDVRVREHAAGELEQLARQLQDNNYRIFADQGQLHLISAGLHLTGTDPFLIFQQLLDREPQNVDAAHAFYLGYEFAKAVTALTLGKEYRQDEALDWGFLTRPEQSHRLPRRRKSPPTT